MPPHLKHDSWGATDPPKPWRDQNAAFAKPAVLGHWPSGTHASADPHALPGEGGPAGGVLRVYATSWNMASKVPAIGRLGPLCPGPPVPSSCALLPDRAASAFQTICTAPLFVRSRLPLAPLTR